MDAAISGTEHIIERSSLAGSIESPKTVFCGLTDYILVLLTYDSSLSAACVDSTFYSECMLLFISALWLYIRQREKRKRSSGL